MVNDTRSTTYDPTHPTVRGRGGAPGSAPAVTIDGLVLLAGLFTAITPWVVDDFADAQRLVIPNLVLGLAVAVIGLVMTAAPAHGFRLSWVLVPIGVWEIVTPWIVGQRPDGVVWTNVVLGAIITALGLAAAGVLVTAMATLRRPHHAQAQPSH
ncbi:SPW repeat protein [Nocardia blacklockiae]|uniref:SPW repeat protein n=1 Tax=Nocardia blacklockiae TaxID=480036 RepID=UPI00189376A9|nr:SPW repeat protein [Nocardia blacklockiae]MBF6170425.1 SPW repeat protein [Nocardia blacklockiae]